MTRFLVKRFIKNDELTDQAEVRTAYGMPASIVGIFCNILLFGGKIAAGILLNSIAVTADAFNNLSDVADSVISFIGVRMDGKPADEDHPFGHGRIEYIAAFIAAFLVIEVGITFMRNAIDKIRNPEELTFQLVSFVILIVSIFVKLWLAAFNRSLGKRIHSQAMTATAADALGDVAATGVTVVAIVITMLTGVNIDGWMGLLVSMIIIWAGINIARDTFEPLIGQAADPKVCRQVTEMVESYEGIVGSHDLIIHNYGPSKSIASIHAEVPNDVDIQSSHEIIDQIERDVLREMGIFLVVHMDPVETKDVHVLAMKEIVGDMVASLDPELSIHDFRLVPGQERENLIFDLVVPYSYKKKEQEQIRTEITEKISAIDKRYSCVITIDKTYIAAEKK